MTAQDVIVACIPSVRAGLALPTLMAVFHQTRPPDVVIVHDESAEGLMSDPLAAAFVRYAGIEVHWTPKKDDDGSHDYSRVSASRRFLADCAELYSPKWIWLVDDDVYPTPDCLDILSREAAHGWPIVAATLLNLLPTDYHATPGAIPEAPRNAGWREHDTIIQRTSGDCWLVDFHAFTDPRIKHSGFPQGGDDLVVSAQIAHHFGNILHKASAIALHLRAKPSTWQENPVTAEMVFDTLARTLGRESTNAVLYSMGVPRMSTAADTFLRPIWPVHEVDGDTWTYLEDDGRRQYAVRRDRDLGIDTPEMHDADPAKRARAEAAKNFRRDWVNRHVVCNVDTLSWPRIDGTPFAGFVEIPYFLLRSARPDAFDRWLSTIDCQAGHNLEQGLLAAGLADVYRR